MSVATQTANEETSPIVEKGAEYLLFGKAKRGGAYNSHLVSGIIFAILGITGVVNPWLVVWLEVCLVAGILIDERSLKKKISLRAIPSQMMLYSQVLLRAMWEALPFYLLAYVLYVGMAPIILKTNLVISSFVMLYGFYMVWRAFWLAKYLWVLLFRWENAGHTFEIHEANLKNRSAAIRHVLWGYFLGNVGLVVRCASQVMTIGLFEFVRQRTSMDLTAYPALADYLMPIFIVGTIIFLATFFMALQPALSIYYRAHRTFHTHLALYDCIHGIHHKGVLPTQLDSGTISPFEFFITEMALPTGMLVPNWWWTGTQVILALVGHLPSHDANSRMKTGHHHLAHHRYFNVNFGLTPAADIRYGTLHQE